MGQIIPFISPRTSYPSATAALGTAECVLLIGMRWWVAGFCADDDPMPRLTAGLACAGAHEAAYPLDALMRIVAQSARHRLEILCPRSPRLAEDEAHLLHGASLVQAGRAALATRVLQDNLISAPGAAFATSVLVTLGDLFTSANLIFPHRQGGLAAMPNLETWRPSDGAAH